MVLLWSSTHAKVPKLRFLTPRNSSLVIYIYITEQDLSNRTYTDGIGIPWVGIMDR